MNQILEYPRLIENNAKYYMHQTLQKCHENKVHIYTTLWNVMIAVIFIVTTAIILYLCAKRKKTPDEEQERLWREQSYVLDKIRSFKELDSYHKQSSTLTKLPVSEPMQIYQADTI